MAFATTDDVATRLGRELTVAEAAMADQVINTVTGLILATIDEDPAWADALESVPTYFTTLCVEKVIVVGTNPSGVAAESETLGAHSHSRTFQRSNDAGIFLTKDERREVRRAADRASLGAVEYETWSEDQSSDLDFTFPLET